MTVLDATLTDGRVIQYVLTDNPPSGGMKKTYFSPDRSCVVQFYHHQSAVHDPQRLSRLEAILGKFNPTITQDKGGSAASQTSADYFKRLFCWPVGIVIKPEIGIVAPTYPDSFFFADGPFKGREKEGGWFLGSKTRRLLPASELGNWKNHFGLCICMARAVRRLHLAGLAHSDLSSKNVLIDPVHGASVIIDIDSLVVPGLYPPDVMGSPGYIAPEVLGTQHLPVDDPNRHLPSAVTDQHALAVLIYQYLLLRHPLRGPKVHSTASAEEDERLAMGSQALFIEHPTDPSNQPRDLNLPCAILGQELANLVQRAFIDGLHTPHKRPAAAEWERGLVKTWDMLIPCDNPGCSHQAFVLWNPHDIRCPFCGTAYPISTLPVLKLRSERRPGQWLADGQIVAFHNQSLFSWHVFDNIYSGELADRTPQAYCVFHQGRWLLINQAMDSLTSPGGNRVPIGSAVELKDRAKFRLSQQPHGRIAEVQLLRIGSSTQVSPASVPAGSPAAQSSCGTPITHMPPATRFSGLPPAPAAVTLLPAPPPQSPGISRAGRVAEASPPLTPHAGSSTTPDYWQEKVKTYATLVIAFGSFTTAITTLISQCHR